MDILSHKGSLLRQADDKNPEVRWKTAETVCSNFKSIEEVLRKKLLNKFSYDSHPGVRMKAVEIISSNFSFMQGNFKYELIEKLGGDGYFGVRKRIVEFLDENFNELKNLDAKFLENSLKNSGNDKHDAVRCSIVKLIDNNFENINRENLNNLIEKFSCDENLNVKIAALELVANHFDEIENRSEIMEKLVSKKQPQVIEKLMKIKPEKLDGYIRQILKSFEKKKPKRTGRKDAVLISPQKELKNRGEGLEVQKTYDLITFSDSPDASSKTFADHAFTGDKSSSVGYYAVEILTKNFDSVPEELRENLLRRFTDDSKWDVRFDAAKIIARHFDYISRGLREELIRKLINDSNPNVREQAKIIISKNFNIIPRDLRRCERDDALEYL